MVGGPSSGTCLSGCRQMAHAGAMRKDEIGKTAWRVMYADDDPLQIISQQRIPYESEEYERRRTRGS